MISKRHSVLRDTLARWAIKVGDCGEGVTGKGAEGVVREVRISYQNLQKLDIECAERQEGSIGQKRIYGIHATVVYPRWTPSSAARSTCPSWGGQRSRLGVVRILVVLQPAKLSSLLTRREQFTYSVRCTFIRLCIIQTARHEWVTID